MSVFGKNIKKIRILKNLNQLEFGKLFDISRGSIGSYEEGRAEPKIDAIIKISRHFKISIDDMLTKELTVNEFVNYANKISEYIPSGKIQHGKPSVPSNTIEVLNERVSRLEKELIALSLIVKKEA